MGAAGEPSFEARSRHFSIELEPQRVTADAFQGIGRL
jgi:hypothetical protein